MVFGALLGLLGCNLSYAPVWIGWKRTNINKRGFVTGLGAASFGIAPFVYGFIFTLIINPNNQSPDKTIHNGELETKVFGEEIYDRFPMTLRYLSIILLIVGLAGASCLYSKPHSAQPNKNFTITVGQLLRMKKFWYLCFLCYFKMFFFMFIINTYKTIEILYIHDDYFLAFVSIAGFSLGAFCRVLCGMLFDKFQWHNIVIWINISEIILTLVFYYVLEYRYLNAGVTAFSIAIAGCSYLSMWIITDKVFRVDKWVFSFVSLTGVFVVLSIFLFTRFIIPVLFI